jgi:hypothetical protein
MGFGAAGCSFLTKPEQGEIQCVVKNRPEDGGLRVDPCPADMYCSGTRRSKELPLTGVCKPEPEGCKSDADAGEPDQCGDDIDNDCDDHVDEFEKTVPEKCDGIDNNCNGLTDEGFDLDEDGVSQCGDLNGKNSRVDCDDRNASVNPGMPDICDGLDNDCDDDFDEAPNGQEDSCEAPLRCSKGSCVMPTCATPAPLGLACAADEQCIDANCVTQKCQPACKANEVCQQQAPTPICIPIPKRPNGAPCSTDTDCASDLCIVREALRLPSDAPRSVCAQSCCRDSDCKAPDETCFVSGTGTRSCLPKTFAVNLATNSAKPALCTSNVAMSGTECPSGQTCGVATLTAATGAQMTPSGTLATTVCRTPTATTNTKFAESCNPANPTNPAGVTCASRLCGPGSNVFQNLCSAPCQTSKDCAELQKAAQSGFFNYNPPAYCQYADLGVTYFTTSIYDHNYVPICIVTRGDEIGTGITGSECEKNADCADGACIGTSSESKGRCAPPCCTNAQCTAVKAELRCRPVIRGVGRYELRCL